jgi:Transposase DDE domain group 1
MGESRRPEKRLGCCTKCSSISSSAAFETTPEELVLDFDCTDDQVHGNQVGAAFHGYYYDYCFLPLYVFCGDQLLVSYLRPSNIDSAEHAWAVVRLLVKALRRHWPKVKITLRADRGFCRWEMLRWCEGNDVNYIVGIAKNDAMPSAPSYRNGLNAGTGSEARRHGFSASFTTRLKAGTRNAGSLPRPNTPSVEPTHVTWSRICRERHRNFTTSFTVPEERRKTASRNNSWGCSVIEQVVMSGGLTSSDYCSPVVLMCLWRACADWDLAGPSWHAPKLAPFA